MARYIHSEIKHKLPLVDRGIRKRDLKVLRSTKMPAVLIECAFISNPHDLQWISLPKNQKLLVQCILLGIQKFLSNS